MHIFKNFILVFEKLTNHMHKKLYFKKLYVLNFQVIYIVHNNRIENF
jgi:hypothetical protein